VILVQNLIVNNISLSGGSGAGLYVFAPSGSTQTNVINNTIAANSAYDNTSGIYTGGFGQYATFTNNIVVAVPGQTAVTCNSLYSSVSPVFSYNDAFAASGTAVAGTCDTTTNPGNIFADPLFMSPGNNDFHLQAGSPAINAGNNSAPNLPNTDFDGNPRIAGTIDLGAYEVVSTSAANISPSSLSFGPQAAGTTSTPQTATLSSTGTTPFQITSVQTTGAFSATTTCPTLGNPGGFSGIAAGNSCAYNVTFAPPAGSSPGTPTGTLTVNGTNGASLVVSLTGTVPSPPPTVSLSTMSLSFASQTVGTTSSPKSVILTNTGNFSLTIASITASQQFSESDNCGASLVGGASCTINISFAPTSAGAVSGILTLTDDATNSPQSVTLSGTGLAPTAVSLSPSSLTFPATPVGTTSDPQTITLTNTGGATLNITVIGYTNPFLLPSQNCLGTLTSGASCQMTVTFRPTAGGPVSGYLQVTDDATGSPQSVTLSGTGIAPAAVSLSPSTLTFAPQVIGITSAAQTVTLTNTGNASLSISSIAASQPFAQTNNCPSSLAGGANCTISVTFTPQNSGNANGGVTIVDNASGSPHSVALSGTGLTPAAVSLSPSTLAFPGTLIGATVTQTVTVTNTGGGSMNIGSLSYPNPFSVPSQNCVGTLAGGASCQITVAFQPTARGPVSGVLQIMDTASGSPHSVSLNGTGLAPAAASLSASSLSFGSQLVATTSAPLSVTLTNTGSASLNISGISAGAPFAQTNNCPASLAGGANCTITVTFRPATRGSFSAVLSITDDATGSPQTVALRGTGVAPVASLSATSLSFAAQLVGTTSATQAVTLSNVGDSRLNISSIAASGDFSQSNNCGASLAAGASCSVTITFTPTTAGLRNGTISIMDDAFNGSPQTVSVAGTGAMAAPTVSPASLSFGNQLVGKKSGNKTVKLTANSPGPLAISSISVSVGFIQTSNCPATLNPGSSCNISITFQPTMAGAITGSLTIVDNGLGSPHTVTLSGTGLDFSVSAAPSSVTINSGAKANYTVTVSELGGSFNQNVSLSCAGLPAQSNCSFSPSGLTPGNGSVNSALTIQTTQANGTSGTQVGTYTITITGKSDSLVHSTTLTLIVQ
jgi:hypothetical protein